MSGSVYIVDSCTSWSWFEGICIQCWRFDFLKKSFWFYAHLLLFKWLKSCSYFLFHFFSFHFFQTWNFSGLNTSITFHFYLCFKMKRNAVDVVRLVLADRKKKMKQKQTRRIKLLPYSLCLEKEEFYSFVFLLSKAIQLYKFWKIKLPLCFRLMHIYTIEIRVGLALQLVEHRVDYHPKVLL